MKKPGKSQLPFTSKGTHRACSVDVPSFTKGLVTLVPSDAAGMIAAPQGGAPASIQAQTVVFGPDSKDAVVVASNVRFRDKSTLNAFGYMPTIDLDVGTAIDPFTMPDVDSAVATRILVPGSLWMIPGVVISVNTAGLFLVTDAEYPYVTLLNTGDSGNAPSGTVIESPQPVTAARTSEYLFAQMVQLQLQTFFVLGNSTDLFIVRNV